VHLKIGIGAKAGFGKTFVSNEGLSDSVAPKLDLPAKAAIAVTPNKKSRLSMMLSPLAVRT